MKTSGIRWLSLILGVLLFILGLIWVLQGAGLIGGSFMTGQARWLVIGVIVVALGLGFVYRGIMDRTKRP